MIDEVWLPVPDYEGFYEVSNHGRVRSLTREICNDRYCRIFEGTILSTGLWYGYEMVWLKKQGARKKFRVHRLVALVHLEVPDDPCIDEVNHKDKNRTNNHVDNLEWLSHIDNCAHRDNNEPF